MVTLELTDEQAAALLTILGEVGGYPELSPRGYCDQVSRKLEALGVVCPDDGYQEEYLEDTSGIQWSKHTKDSFDTYVAQHNTTKVPEFEL